MGRADVTVTVKASVDQAFAFVADPANTTRFMKGMKTYRPITAKDRGKGARFATVIEIAGKKFESELETTAYVEGERIVGESRSGPKTRGTWIFEEYDDGTTDVTMQWEYELPGVFRFVPGAGGIVEKGMEDSLKKLRTLIEAEASKATRKPAAKSKAGPGKKASKPKK